MIIGKLLNKTSSANGDSNGPTKETNSVKGIHKPKAGNKATEEAVAFSHEVTHAEEKAQANSKPLQLKSSKPVQDSDAFAKKNPQTIKSEENDFIDYDDDFAEDFEEQNDEGIKVSSSDIEPVSFDF